MHGGKGTVMQKKHRRKFNIIFMISLLSVTKYKKNYNKIAKKIKNLKNFLDLKNSLRSLAVLYFFFLAL